MIQTAVFALFLSFVVIPQEYVRAQNGDVDCEALDLFDCNDGQNCIKHSHMCNCKSDCPGGYDETPEVCGSEKYVGNQFRCSDSYCIDSSQVCDCSTNCADGSDEDFKMCSEIRQGVNCSFYCPNGLPYTFHQRCDCRSDCPGGEDEQNCETFPSFHRWECEDGNGCVNSKNICDCPPGEQNCNDGHHCADRSDENLQMCDEEFECWSCNTYFTDLRRNLDTNPCESGLFDERRAHKRKCHGQCITRRIISRTTSNLPWSVVIRGCFELPVENNAPERCYDLTNSNDLEDLVPWKSSYRYDERTVSDEVVICRGDLCNDKPVDPARFCPREGREEGVGKLAASILASTGSGFTPYNPVLYFFATVFML